MYELSTVILKGNIMKRLIAIIALCGAILTLTACEKDENSSKSAASLSSGLVGQNSGSGGGAAASLRASDRNEFGGAAENAGACRRGGWNPAQRTGNYDCRL